MVCVYILKNSPAVLFCHQELLSEYPVNAEFYSSAFSIPSLMKSCFPHGIYNILSEISAFSSAPSEQDGYEECNSFKQLLPVLPPPSTFPSSQKHLKYESCF